MNNADKTIKQINIGNIIIANPILLAPMEGITDLPFRLLCKKYGADIVNKIVLIEPSELAIKRASLHVKKYAPNISVKTVCRKLDELTEQDLAIEHTNTTIHLFSNILDIDDYSQGRLIKLINATQLHKNTFVCVSPNINDIKTERLESFKRYFEKNNDTYELLMEVTTSKNSTDPYWNCNNNYTKQKCNNHPMCGCENQWTRVIKVFKVELF